MYSKSKIKDASEEFECCVLGTPIDFYEKLSWEIWKGKATGWLMDKILIGFEEQTHSNSKYVFEL